MLMARQASLSPAIDKSMHACRGEIENRSAKEGLDNEREGRIHMTYPDATVQEDRLLNDVTKAGMDGYVCGRP